MRGPSAYATPGHRSLQQITITLWRNITMRDWSVVINGQRHEHVTTEVVEALVECALIVAETSLTYEDDYDPDPSASLDSLRRQ
jgi:hypothetical protein